MSKVRSGTSIASLAGEDFGPYRLVRRLGVGGMAETYEAIRRGPSGFAQHVCLKLVLPFFRDNPDFVELFEREARLAAKLRHSNIVGIIDFGSIDGIPYMALELVDGADLRIVLDHQDGARLSPDLVALIGSEIAAALEHAHSPSGSATDGSDAIIHRDVSPSNVLISRHGEILLSDFGVAKAISGTSRQQSAVKGKVPYMSPEQLRAEPLDGRADLFALGVVMFEALGGQRPYEGAHDPATIMLTLEGNHPSLASLAPSAPPRLCEIIESLIRPNREERPSSAAELIDLLDELVPSPRARRQLGSMADECRPPALRHDEGRRLGETDEAAADDQDASPKVTTGVQRTDGAIQVAPTANLGSEGAASPQTPRQKPNGRVLAALALGAVVAAGAYLAQSRTEGPSAPTREAEPATLDVVPDEPPVSPEPVVEQPPAEAPVAPDTPTSPSRTEPRDPHDAVMQTPEATSPRPARLTVIVFPWGNVWIDGKLRGPAPLKNEVLKPGRYRISVGQDAPFKSRTVRLRPGQRQTLDFDLTK